MDSADHIIPPLTWNCATKEIAFGYPGKPLNIRNASEGHFSIYGDYSSDHGRFVIGISFEEDHLPVLGRQVMYHYLDAADNFVWETEGCLELIIPNFIVTPSSEVERQAVMWRIRFGQRELLTLQSMLGNLRLPADLLKVNRLPKATKDIVYYNLRASLMELPVPKSMGSVGHWQSPLAGGTPRFPPHVERAFVNQSMGEIESRQQDARFLESSILDFEQRQAALDFAKAASIDYFDPSSGKVILYDDFGRQTPAVRASGATTPSHSKAPPRSMAGNDNGDASGAETERATDTQSRKASAASINQLTQTHGVYNSKRIRPTSSDADKDGKTTIKNEKKRAKDDNDASTGTRTGVRFSSGQSWVGMTDGMGMLHLRGGETAVTGNLSESTVLGNTAPEDDWCTLVNADGDEICRWRLRDCIKPGIVPDYITVPKGCAIINESAARSALSKRRGFRASVRSDTDSDIEEALFQGEETAYVGNE